jgi:ferredoxin
VIVSCELCGASLVFNMHPVDWPKPCRGAYCTTCHRVYALVLEVVKESDLSKDELKARKVRNT